MKTASVRWIIYTVAGIPDGSHFWPLGEMFSNTKERIQCVVSVSVNVAFSVVSFHKRQNAREI